MADGLDLDFKDYDNFIEHCLECSGTLAIKQYLGGKIKKYLADNDDMVIVLMERIEKKYSSKVKYDLDSKNPFHEREISNFQLDCPKDKNAPLKFLYSYLNFLSHYDDVQTDILGRKQLQPVPVRSRLSFGIDSKHRESLLGLTKKLIAHVEFIKERDGIDSAQMFVELLMAKDLNILHKEGHEVHFGCAPGVLHLIIQNIISAYNRDEFLKVMEECGLFYDKKGKPIQRGRIDTGMSRTHKYVLRRDHQMVNRIFKECPPAK